MKEFQIETAQNVAIHQNAAPLLDRMLGYIIDSCVIFFYGFSAILLLRALDFDFRDAWAIYLLVTLPAFLYYVLLETFWDGLTIGKFVVKTRVVKLDGSKAGFGNYFVRWILRFVDIVLTSGALAVVTILVKGNGQRLGDIAAGTTVVSEKRKVSINDTVLKDIAPDYRPKYAQVTLFSDSEMQTIKNLYEQAIRQRQHNVINKLYDRIVTVMQIVPSETPINFINTVIKDYNYYTQNM
ncbi:RDD family protein [Bizionia gelidisalsuginis]|uniref:RDD family protein n=2 Tax=Bizionia TaxID=283785 RepID=A0A8H2LP09_9FLAO|nr:MULTISPECIES: RDD family protein [Bizionia]TYB77482.1 RDD family protein [Bizionia saleffrena]TYC17837.1 RDD family protein [Bizionia gelidisalsuginis]